MNRRSLLFASAGGAWLLLTGHSPYRRFQIYRKTRLIVMAANEDKRAAIIADGLAEFFAKAWTESQSISGRAQTAPDLVQLLVTNQLEVGVLSKKEARAAREGKNRFSRSGPQALCVLAIFGDHVLITREDLLEPIAVKILEPMTKQWQLVKAEVSQSARGPFAGEATGLPLHRVAVGFAKKS
ncbi:MAG: hypothetical protein ABIP64_05975 [Burkholderiales bacterium]